MPCSQSHQKMAVSVQPKVNVVHVTESYCQIGNNNPKHCSHVIFRWYIPANASATHEKGWVEEWGPLIHAGSGHCRYYYIDLQVVIAETLLEWIVGNDLWMKD
jgi:hypothetical protein